MRYFITLSYLGKDFIGWQKQAQGLSVQGVLETCLSKLLKQPIDVIGAGRTDSGVHAKKMIAHIDSLNKMEASLITKINAFLPKSIAISKIELVKNEAHARFDAISRTYEYWICKRKNPFTQDLSWHIPYKNLNINLINQASSILLETEDFAAFARKHSDNKTTLCHVFQAQWENKNDETLIFTIKADRFLRNMVRALVGTLVDVGRGKITIKDFRLIIKQKNRALASTSAPAHGLFLVDVLYPNEIWIK